jgi:hypothetical protein
MEKKVWKASKYSLGARGFSKEEIESAIAGLPVKISQIRNPRGGFWIDYAGDARRDGGAGLSVLRIIIRRLVAMGGEYYEHDMERGWHKVTIAP